jgi:hypothetical protein
LNVPLKCVNCGAPLPPPEKDSDLVKCEYCGYYQKVVDASNYVERLKLEVLKWLSQIIPSFNVPQGLNVDPIARSNIFSMNVKPKIIPILIQVKSKLSMILTKPLITLPFFKNDIKTLEEPKKIFEELTKIQGVNQLVVTDEDSKFYSEVTSVLTTYAHINLLLDGIAKNEISLIIKNLQEIVKSLEINSKDSGELYRFKGILSYYQGLNYIYNNDISGFENSMNTSLNFLQIALDKAMKDPNQASIIPALQFELNVVEVMERISKISLRIFEFGKSPLEIFNYFNKYFNLIKNYNKIELLLKDILPNVLDIFEAKLGLTTVNTIFSKGNQMLPFYEVYITYTFTTGSLFWKKGKSYKDRLLVLATYPYAQTYVTDIFKTNYGFWDKVKGKEETLSGGYLEDLFSRVTKSSIPSSVKVIPPLISKEDAEIISDNYIKSVSQRFNGKITFSASEVGRLIYISFEILNNDVHIELLKNSQVKLGQYLNKLLEIGI